MKRMLWVLAFMALPAGAVDAPSGCARLCGNWVLDAARSEPAEPVIDAALDKYKEPAPPKRRRPPREDPLDPAPDLADEPPARPPEHTFKAQLRTQLLATLTQPESLEVAARGDEILIRTPGTLERRLFPGEPHSRVDSTGTTRIDTEWKQGALVVKETEGRKHKRTETWTQLPDGALQVTLVVERPDLATLHLRAFYRPGQAVQGLPTR
jgi:hypothetical protein